MAYLGGKGGVRGVVRVQGGACQDVWGRPGKSRDIWERPTSPDVLESLDVQERPMTSGDVLVPGRPWTSQREPYHGGGGVDGVVRNMSCLGIRNNP